MNINRRKFIKWLILLLTIFFVAKWLSSPPVRFSLIPPEDLYVPVTKGFIDVSRVDAEYSFEFVNKYRGYHDIGIAVSKFPQGYYQDNKMSFEAEIKIYQNGKPLLTRDTTKATAYLGGYNKIGGFEFTYYKVPEDLPQSTPLLCTVNITKANKNFENVYGRPEFFIRKGSDK